MPTHLIDYITKINRYISVAFSSISSTAVATARRLSRSTAKHHRLIKIKTSPSLFMFFLEKSRTFRGLEFYLSNSTTFPIFKDPWEPFLYNPKFRQLNHFADNLRSWSGCHRTTSPDILISCPVCKVCSLNTYG